MKNIKNLWELQMLMQKTIQKNTPSSDLMDVIVNKPPISTEERIKIYQNAYFMRMTESICDDFSRVEIQLGLSSFQKLVSEFVRKTPSKFRNLAEYSEGFVSFVKKKKPEAYLGAVSDWLEILSLSADSPRIKLNQNEIENGTPFYLKLMPTSILRKVEDEKYLMAYLNNSEVTIMKLDSMTLSLSLFFETEKSLNELIHFSIEKKIDETALIATTKEWIKKNIIYCKPIDT